MNTFDVAPSVLRTLESSESKTANRLPLVLRAIVIASLLASLIFAVRYSGQHILEAHAFRQTQTALSAYWLLRDGFQWAYETPSIGYPWSIPFEFPIYEWMAALLSSGLHVGLERTGRLLSYAFLLACIVPVAQTLRIVFPSSWRLQTSFFIPLFLLSPVYLFWGRSFMIETAALFFTLCFVRMALPFVQGSPAWSDALLASLFLTLAFLQKSTTVLPVWLIMLAVVACRSNLTMKMRFFIFVSPKNLITFIAPFLAGAAWAKYTDAVKLRNVAGQHLTSQGLFAWNFGTVAMRFSADLWRHAVWNRIFTRNVAGLLGIALLAAAFACLTKRERWFIGLNLAALFLPILVFENLHYIHDYYQTANVVYLLLAVAIALAGLMNRFPARKLLLLASLAAILGVDVLAFFYSGYAAASKVAFTASNSRTIALAEYLKANTSSEKPLVVYGMDWSAEVPFFSQRRTLGVPNWFTPRQNREIILNPAKYVEQSPSAIVFCGAGLDELKALAKSNRPASGWAAIHDCDVSLVR